MSPSGETFDLLYRRGEHAALVESFPLWLECNVGTSDELTIFHNLNLYLTVLSEFGLLSESRLLPDFNVYMNTLSKLSETGLFKLLPEDLMEKHLIILIEGYGQTKVACEEYCAYTEISGASGNRLLEIYNTKLRPALEQKNLIFRGYDYIKCSQRYIFSKLNNSRKIGVGVALFFLVIILLWIRKNVPKFWSKLAVSTSFLAYSLLAPI